MHFVLPTPCPFIASGLVRPIHVIYNIYVKNRDISAVHIKVLLANPISLSLSLLLVSSVPLPQVSHCFWCRELYGHSLARIKML